MKRSVILGVTGYEAASFCASLAELDSDFSVITLPPLPDRNGGRIELPKTNSVSSVIETGIVDRLSSYILSRPVSKFVLPIETYPQADAVVRCGGLLVRLKNSTYKTESALFSCHFTFAHETKKDETETARLLSEFSTSLLNYK